jgi:hypothetical protein
MQASPSDIWTNIWQDTELSRENYYINDFLLGEGMLIVGFYVSSHSLHLYTKAKNMKNWCFEERGYFFGVKKTDR